MELSVVDLEKKKKGQNFALIGNMFRDLDIDSPAQAAIGICWSLAIASKFELRFMPPNSVGFMITPTDRERNIY